MACEWQNVVSVALFLEGCPLGAALPRRLWPQVVRELGGLSALGAPTLALLPRACQWVAERLVRRGFFEAAASFGHIERFEWALGALDSGRAIGCGAPGLPAAWAAEGLAFHARGGLGGWSSLGHDNLVQGLAWPSQWVALVGSRRPSTAGRAFALAVARWAVARGFGVLSGGAPGIDRCARRVPGLGGHLIEVLPMGLGADASWAFREPGLGNGARVQPKVSGGFVFFEGRGAKRNGLRCHGQENVTDCGLVECASGPASGSGEEGPGGGSGEGHLSELQDKGGTCPLGKGSWAQLSPAGHQEGFSTALAMHRNRLLYSAAVLAIVIDPRFKAGGSWHGAVLALRQRLCRVCVFGGVPEEGPAPEFPASIQSRGANGSCKVPARGWGKVCGWCDSGSQGECFLGPVLGPVPASVSGSITEADFAAPFGEPFGARSIALHSACSGGGANGPAVRALAALGAVPVDGVHQLDAALAQPPMQPLLFAC